MSAVVKLHGKMLAFSRLSILGSDIDEIISALDVYTQKQDKTMPVLIDSEQLLDLAILIERLWAVNIAVIGVVDGVLSKQATDLRLAVFPNDGKRIARLDDNLKSRSDNDKSSSGNQAQALVNGETIKSQTPDEHDKATTHTNNQIALSALSQAELPKSAQGDILVCHQMVRSGQSVHHMGGDLVIAASVNTGAEVATDYNLHIYGKGQGRLVAGATGDERARIFCQKFDPSLVSVAGAYCLKDDIPSEMIGQAVEVRFCQEKGLIFTLMSG